MGVETLLKGIVNSSKALLLKSGIYTTYDTRKRRITNFPHTTSLQNHFSKIGFRNTLKGR